MVTRLRDAERDLERLSAARLLDAAAELAGGAEDVGGVAFVAHRVPDGTAADGIRKLALDVRGRLAADRPGVVVVAGVPADRPTVVVAVNDAARARGLTAGALVLAAAGALGGRGGGRDDVAQGGGAPLGSDAGPAIERSFVAVRTVIGDVPVPRLSQNAPTILCANTAFSLLARFFYLTYMLVLPVMVLGKSPLLVAGAFLLVHLFVGLAVTLVFQTTHTIDTTYFPMDRGEFDNGVYHIFATTADYATENPLVGWLAGGLDHHIVHHLCPFVCHTHYAPLTRIVKETAEEFGVPYRQHPTMRNPRVPASAPSAPWEIWTTTCSCLVPFSAENHVAVPCQSPITEGAGAAVKTPARSAKPIALVAARWQIHSVLQRTFMIKLLS